jgi:acyl transferase domain-containing protein
MAERTGLEVAVIGMAGRFPGSATVEELWRDLRAGVESITRFSDEELAASGVAAELRRDPRYVPAAAVLDDVDLFDPELFGYAPGEAALIDPQHRLFLECCYEALERAGHAGTRLPVGVFAGVAKNSYLLHTLLRHRELLDPVGPLAVHLASEKDFVATRVAYKLDLEGPAVTVQTACSTSLAAVHLACQSLLTGDCSLVLAGGASIRVPQRIGYLYEEGGIRSPDGHCRAFDARAAGTVHGQGVGVVVLRLLDDAVEAGDHIHAVIRATAMNNDGALKAGFTAPRREGQARVVRTAQVRAGVEPGSIQCIEAHGTATALGDPIEVAALTDAFRRGTDRTGFCALGSLKTNLGHLDAAAGVAGLIKAVLAVEAGEIPPSLHFETPNPAIDFESSPFYVNAELRPWPASGGPRRAGVSSFGIGGTNVHAIIEEAPTLPPSGPSRRWQLLVLSARSARALEAGTDRLAGFLREHPELSLPDAAHTLRTGRWAHEHRRIALCRTPEEAAAVLESRDGGRTAAGRAEGGSPAVAFLFPGQGAQHPGMGRDLYEGEEVFRRDLDASLDLLRVRHDVDLRPLLFPRPSDLAAAEAALEDTALAQPALFAVEHALAELWRSWGVRPWALLGHSVGEYAAACLAGVLSREAALHLVVQRGALMQALPRGAMLATELPEDDLSELLTPGLGLAAVNGPTASVAAGPKEEIAVLEARLRADGTACRRLRTSHAFHSPMMDPVVDRFRAVVEGVELRPPGAPFVSGVTGTWITREEATDPGYWARQLREPVRFGAGLSSLLAEPGAVLLEVGPGRSLAALAARVRPPGGPARTVGSMRHPKQRADDDAVLLEALGRLWLAGVPVSWEAFTGGERRRRVVLPTYPFERRRCWLEPPAPERAGAEKEGPVAVREPAAAAGDPRPSDSVERWLTEAWQALLGVEGLGPDDDLFALGAHSLMATRIATRAREAFGVELAIGTFFEAPTIGALADRLRTARPGGGGPPPLAPVPRDGDLPLSFAQQRLLFLHALAPDDPAYNLSLGLRLQGPLSPAGLRGALARVVRRHEALRTTFVVAAGKARPVIAAEAAVALPVVDLSRLPGAAAVARAEALVLAEKERPIDILRGPVFRALLARLGADDHALLLTLHHVATDGWSTAILCDELVEHYLDPEAPRVAPLQVQYADFAAGQRRWLEGGELDRQLAYWRARLAALPATEVPADRPRPPVRSGRGASEPLSWPPELADAARALSRECGATLFMTLSAGLLVVLHRECRQDDLVLGTDVANRRWPETEALIGLFVNQVVLRCSAGGDPTFRELLGRVRRVALEAYDHQDAPFDRVVEELNPPRDLSRTPLFQVKLVLQSAPFEGRSIDDLSISLFGPRPRTAKFDLLFNLADTPAGLRGRLEHSRDLWTRPSALRLLRAFRHALEVAVARPEAHLCEIETAIAENDRRLEEHRSLARRDRRLRSVGTTRRKTIAIEHNLGDGR